MHWELLERGKSYLRLVAIAAGDRDAVTARVRDAFSESGAWITDVHFFSGVQTMFSFEAASDALWPLAQALARAGLRLDEASRTALDEATERASGPAPGDLEGTLAVIFAHGDPDMKHEVPAVPG